MTPPSLLRHQRVLANLQFELTRHVREHGLGEILPAPVRSGRPRSVEIERNPDAGFEVLQNRGRK